MRVLHVVTLVSDDGAFGGPVSVASNQAAALIARGTDVRLAGGWRGASSPPASVHGAPAHLFPVRQVLPRGFSGLFSAAFARWLHREIGRFDLVHLHAGRDLMSLTAMF